MARPLLKKECFMARPYNIPLFSMPVLFIPTLDDAILRHTGESKKNQLEILEFLQIIEKTINRKISTEIMLLKVLQFILYCRIIIIWDAKQKCSEKI